MNDYHAFNSTSGGSGSGGGFPWKTAIIIAIICAVLTWIGECKYG